MRWGTLGSDNPSELEREPSCGFLTLFALVQDEEDRVMPPQHMILKAKRFDLHAGIRMWGGYPAVARMLERQRPERVPVSLQSHLN